MQQSFLGPGPLFLIGAAAAALGVLMLLWVVGRGLGGLIDTPRVPRPGTTYVAFAVFAAFLGTVSALAFGLRELYLEYMMVGGRSRIGQLKCEALPDNKVKAVFTPGAGADPAVTVESPGPGCKLTVDLLRMRGYPSTGPVGLGSLVRVAAIGDSPRPSIATPQLAPDRLPVKLLVQRHDHVEVLAAPDANATYAVIATPAGTIATATDGKTLTLGSDGKPIPPPENGTVVLERE